MTLWGKKGEGKSSQATNKKRAKPPTTTVVAGAPAGVVASSTSSTGSTTTTTTTPTTTTTTPATTKGSPKQQPSSKVGATPQVRRRSRLSWLSTSATTTGSSGVRSGKSGGGGGGGGSGSGSRSHDAEEHTDDEGDGSTRTNKKERNPKGKKEQRGESVGQSSLSRSSSISISSSSSSSSGGGGEETGDHLSDTPHSFSSISSLTATRSDSHSRSDASKSRSESGSESDGNEKNSRRNTKKSSIAANAASDDDARLEGTFGSSKGKARSKEQEARRRPGSQSIATTTVKSKKGTLTQRAAPEPAPGPPFSRHTLNKGNDLSSSFLSLSPSSASTLPPNSKGSPLEGTDFAKRHHLKEASRALSRSRSSGYFSPFTGRILAEVPHSDVPTTLGGARKVNPYARLVAEGKIRLSTPEDHANSPFRQSLGKRSSQSIRRTGAALAATTPSLLSANPSGGGGGGGSGLSFHYQQQQQQQQQQSSHPLSSTSSTMALTVTRRDGGVHTGISGGGGGGGGGSPFAAKVVEPSFYDLLGADYVLGPTGEVEIDGALQILTEAGLFPDMSVLMELNNRYLLSSLIFGLADDGASVVYTSLWRENVRQVFAIKVRQLTREVTLESPPSDVVVLTHLGTDHPSIAPLVEWMPFPHAKSYAVVTPFYESANAHVIRQSEAHMIAFAFSLMSALHFVHGRGVIHNDIKPSNVLYDPNVMLAYLIDWDCAQFYVSTSPPTQSAGTDGYIAPEVLEHVPYDYKCDVYSAGVVLYELVINSSRCGRNTPAIIQGDLADLEETPIVSLLKRMTAASPRERPTAAEVLLDPFFAAHWKTLKRRIKLGLV